MKQKLIITGAIILAIVLFVIFFKYNTMWTSILSIVMCLCGVVGGWYGKGIYDKYIKKPE